VVDMSGNLLSRPRREGIGDDAQMSDAMLEYKQAVEHDLAAKIAGTLEPLVGADKFRTGVSADIDMTSGEQSEETFDPSKSVMTSSQKVEDQSGTTRISPGIPGTASNLPPQQTVASNAAQPPAGANPPAEQGGQQPGGQQPAGAKADPAPARAGGNTTTNSRRSENITYQTSRITKHLKLPQGTVKRLSIAVLVDQGSHMEGKGAQAHRVVNAPDPDKLKAIQTLVGTLVGLDAMRGDQLTVEALPFDTSMEDVGTLAPAPKKPAPFSVQAVKEKPALYGGSATAIVVALAMLAFVMMRNRKPAPQLQTQEALPAATVDSYANLAAPKPAGLGTAAALAEPVRVPALMPSRTEVLLNQLTENSRNNSEAWANILRGWLAEEEPQ